MAFMHRWGCERKRTLRVISSVATILLVFSTMVTAGGAERGVLLDVRDARLAEVVLLLTQQSGANIVINPDVADKRVTAHLDGLPLESVLDHVVKKMAGVDYWKDEDGTFIIGGQRPVMEEPAVIEAPVVQVAPQSATPAPKSRTEIIKLVNWHPTELLVEMGLLSKESYKRPGTFAGMGYAGSVGVLDEDKANTGIITPSEPRTYEDAGELGVYTSPPAIDSGVRPYGEAGRSANPELGAAQYSPQNARTRNVPGTTGTPRGTAAPGPSTTSINADSLLPEGVDHLQPFPHDNSLIVRGTEEGIAEFKEIIHLLDVPPKQVSIKAEFIEVSTSDVKRFGIDWSLERLNETINTNFNPAGNVIIGVTTGNLAASIRAELTRSAGKIINSPIISTINNQYAQISIGSVIPYWTTILTPAGVGSGGGVVQTQQVNQLQVSTYLSVLPRVNGDGTITLLLTPSVQDTGRIFKDPTGNSEIPEVRYQTLYTQRRVMNGETIVVGGFIRKDESVNVTQIPILGSLPIIGPLFRSTDKTSQDRELLIFVTPTIIGEKSAGSAVGVSPY